MENFEIPEDLTYTEKIRKFEPTDPAHADLLNMTVQALVNNITFLKRVLGKQGVDIQGQLQQQYEQLTGYTDTKIGELINGAPETLDTIKEVADAILENKNVPEALNEAVGKKLNKEGDASDTTVAFTSEDDENPAAWATMRKIVSGKLKDVLGSVSLMAKNLRYLRKLLGASDISKLADGTVTGALSKLNTDLGGRYAVVTSGPNSRRKLVFSGGFSAIVSAVGLEVKSQGIFFVQGYGIVTGDCPRIHVATIYSGGDIECYTVEGEEAVYVRNKVSVCHIAVFMLYGVLPTFVI